MDAGDPAQPSVSVPYLSGQALQFRYWTVLEECGWRFSPLFVGAGVAIGCRARVRRVVDVSVPYLSGQALQYYEVHLDWTVNSVSVPYSSGQALQ